MNKIFDHISERALAHSLGLGVTAVYTAKSSGKFPASWYGVVRALCLEKGIDCPMSLFNFKSPPMEQQDA